MLKHLNLVLILVCSNHDPSLQGPQRGTNILHICRVSGFVAQMSDVTPGPLLVFIIEDVKRMSVSCTKCLSKINFVQEKHCLIVGQ